LRRARPLTQDAKTKTLPPSVAIPDEGKVMSQKKKGDLGEGALGDLEED